MLNFSSLRQQLSDGCLWVVPIGVAVALHISLVAFGARTEKRLLADADPTPAAGMVVDNTAQLVRLTRRAVQRQTLPTVGLDLSGTLPPPPPELLDDVVLPESPPIDCPPDGQSSKATDRGSPSEAVPGVQADSSQSQSPAAPARSSTSIGMDGDAASPGITQGRPALDDASVNRLWNTAMGVPIWPGVLGPKPADVELRELPLSAFDGRAAEELHTREFTTAPGRLRLMVSGKRVFLVLMKTDS